MASTMLFFEVYARIGTFLLKWHGKHTSFWVMFSIQVGAILVLYLALLRFILKKSIQQIKVFSYVIVFAIVFFIAAISAAYEKDESIADIQVRQTEL